MKTALICGVSGQDGAYLAKLLIEKGYKVVGTSRDAQVSSFKNLHQLGIYDSVSLESMVLTDFRSVLKTISKSTPDEIYNLAGQTSVALSFQQPVETLESISVGTLNLLEVLRFTGSNARLYNAGSSECFGDTAGQPANEGTAFHPRSPYAVAKAAAFWQVANYREAYGLYAASGILFNHESPLRPERFVTKKIIAAASRIAEGSCEKLRLGNLNIQRDWGWAPEYVEAMWMILQQDSSEDFVIATGETYSLECFVEAAFVTVGLNWRDHVVVDNSLLRPTDLMISRANPEKAHVKLGWQARMKMHEVVSLVMKEEIHRLRGAQV